MEKFFKIAGCVFTLFSAGGIGFYYSYKIRRRIGDLRWYFLAVTEIGGKIRIGSQELSSILKNIRNSEKYYSVTENSEVILKHTSLTHEDENYINEFFKELGLGDSDSQIKRCLTYERIFRSRLENSEADINEKSKLCRTFGILAGCGIVLLLI